MNPSLRALILAHAQGVTPTGIAFDPARLLLAIAVVESSGGLQPWLRHEASWCPNMRGLNVVRATDGVLIARGGANVNAIVRARFARWGCAACCSAGPFQIHYQTAADRGWRGAPWELVKAEVSIELVIRQLNRIIAGPEPSETVEHLADAWNSGNYRDANRVEGYRAKVRAAYDQESA